MKVSELITHLQTNFSLDDHVCAPIWQAGDVQHVADDMELTAPLSDEQVADVLYSLDKNHDACFGITWETIEHAINVVTQY